MTACTTDMIQVQTRLRHVPAQLRRERRREAAAARYACSRDSMQDVLRRKVALSLLHLRKHDATVAVQCLLAQPGTKLPLQPCKSERVHEWEEERVAAGHEDPLQPASRDGLLP